MSGSLVQHTSAFKGLRWAQVLTLINVLNRCELCEEQHIEKRYKESSSNFSETLTFLDRIGIIKRDNCNILCVEELHNIQNARLRSIILERVLQSRNRYRGDIFKYLGKFHFSNGEVGYHSDGYNRSAESAVRNFLIEMGAVVYKHQEDRYLLAPEYILLYIHARNRKASCPPSRITAVSAEHAEIGLSAERAVVEIEKHRVGSAFADKVDHVAIRNAAAGYDVLSVTSTPTLTIPRYIEVKAVSLQSYQFYWTRNEVQVARELGSLYYLYLLPVKGNHVFLVDQLVMVCDPYANVLNIKDKWVVETDVLLCRPRYVKSLQKELSEV